MTDFNLHPRLAADSHYVADLALCQVRLNDDARFPWLVLVPRRADIREVYELSTDDQATLWQEATEVGRRLMTHHDGDKLNLATLGNQVAQLHLHVIVRHQDDAAWPGPVWGQGTPQPYDDMMLDTHLATLRNLLAPCE
ncbi:HIT domain-containing protein [Chromohalobacter nigrandesensis]|uniref:HIT domain-containing protein n=1 Tax=Chromohalobacter nigrandesensis TaxID=119863 RepID=UPI001FF49377|nr:HIT domain-containing protein [Chromohalobacter nigrandesensis]MCK0745499.1 HIT domain-containing protein [Chromohalobacter nigrandesensis]